MKEDFKKWLCELAEIKPEDMPGCDHRLIGTLIKAMWAINRESIKSKEWSVEMSSWSYDVFSSWLRRRYKFSYENHDNSEQEALIKALEYIYNNSVKELE